MRLVCRNMWSITPSRSLDQTGNISISAGKVDFRKEACDPQCGKSIPGTETPGGGPCGWYVGTCGASPPEVATTIYYRVALLLLA